MDNDESRNALYQEPRRIIQNQIWIQLLIILAIAIPIPLGRIIFGLVFCIAPAIVIPTILVVQTVGSVSYIVMKAHVERQNKKS